MADRTFLNANLVLPDRVVPGGLTVRGGRIAAVGAVEPVGEIVDLGGLYLAPGFVDLHVHGGGGADFMDLTPDAFRQVCATHATHGTTTLTPTSTAGDAGDSREFLRLCQAFRDVETGGARVGGAHLYGPYFRPAARGCHPDRGFETPDAAAVPELIRGFDESFPLTVTIAPELPGAIDMTRAAAAAGVRVNIGHSYATYEQVEAAVAAGARHVDHLFCAMSDRARLRLEQPFPMRAGVMEATLALPHLTTEVIADGTHLADSLLKFAFTMLPDRLCLVTDSSRAVDMPDGEYWFGPTGRGTRILKRGDRGLTPDGTALGSGVVGLDHCVRTMLRATGAPLHAVIRTASLIPAAVIGLQSEIGSLAVGKRADLIVLDAGLRVAATHVAPAATVGRPGV